MKTKYFYVLVLGGKGDQASDPNGTYVLKFTTEKGTVSKQFIKN